MPTGPGSCCGLHAEKACLSQLVSGITYLVVVEGNETQEQLATTGVPCMAQQVSHMAFYPLHPSTHLVRHLIR